MEQGSAERQQPVVAKNSNTLSRAEALQQRIEASKQRLEKLKREKKALERREKVLASKEERRRDTRRKILLGSMVLAEAEKDASVEAQLQGRLDAYLMRDEDRALFNLPKRLQSPADPFQQAVIAAGGRI